ncbi:MAG: hypothetical protein GWP36_02595 [Bacteroidetes bacterium]|jgi:hypothetical protein|nr:hypothetical protein [Bacteroidota bacterium]
MKIDVVIAGSRPIGLDLEVVRVEDKSVPAIYDGHSGASLALARRDQIIAYRGDNSADIGGL